MFEKTDLFAKKITAEEAKNFIHNVEHIRLKNWTSTYSIAKKMYNMESNKLSSTQVITQKFKKWIPDIDFVRDTAKALKCSPEELLAPPARNRLSNGARDFINEAIQKQFSGFNDIASKIKIPSDKLDDVITHGFGKFDQHQIQSLMSAKFNLHTLAPFAHNEVDLMELTKTPFNKFSNEERKWYDQRKAVERLKGGMHSEQLSKKAGISHEIYKERIQICDYDPNFTRNNLAPPPKKEWNKVLHALGASEISESQLVLMGRYSLNSRQTNELIQCENILRQYSKNMPKTEIIKKITEKELYNFYISLKQEWSNLKFGPMTKDAIENLITKVGSKKFLLLTSTLLTAAVKSAPALAIEIAGEEVKEQLDRNAEAALQENSIAEHFVNRLGSHLIKFMLLVPKGISGAISTPLVKDKQNSFFQNLPSRTVESLIDLPFRTIDNFIAAEGYNQSIVNDWKELAGAIFTGQNEQNKNATIGKPNLTRFEATIKKPSAKNINQPLSPFQKLNSGTSTNTQAKFEKIYNENKQKSTINNRNLNQTRFEATIKKSPEKTINHPSTPTQKLNSGTNTNTHTHTNFEKIYKNKTDVTTQASQILSEIHTSYQAIHQLKLLEEQKEKAEIAKARFDAVTQGFNVLRGFGHQTGNKTIERIGSVGMSLVQGTFGIAQLTGSFGVPIVTGFNMVMPIAGIATAALSLGSLLFASKNKDQSKAMQKMFTALSNQITQLHRDMSMMNTNMTKGFNAVMMGLGMVNESLDIGFNSVHEAMSKYFSNNTRQLAALAELSNKQFARIHEGLEALLESQMSIFELLKHDYIELDCKLDDQNLFLNKMDGKLNDIFAELQKLGFKDETAAKNKMPELLEQLQVIETDKDSARIKLCKLLQSIRSQLLLASNSLKSLDVKGNSFSGWYHLSSLEQLFSEPDFRGFSLDYANMTNLQWAQSAHSCFFTLLLSQQDFSHPIIDDLRSDIFSIMKRSIKPTKQLIQTLADENFLKTFFAFHQKRIIAIQARAEIILKQVRETMSQPAMRDYAHRILSKVSTHKEALFQLVKDNTKGMSEQFVQEELLLLTKEYNHCIQNFKIQTNVIFSLLEIDTDSMKSIKRKFDLLQPLAEL